MAQIFAMSVRVAPVGIDESTAEAEGIVGRPHDGTGWGYGGRLLTYRFETAAERDAAKTALEAVNVAGEEPKFFVEAADSPVEEPPVGGETQQTPPNQPPQPPILAKDQPQPTSEPEPPPAS